MLMADAGGRLRELVARERDLRRGSTSCRSTPSCNSTSPRAPTSWSRSASPTSARRAAGEVRGLLDEVDPAGDDEERLRAKVPRVGRRAEELAAFGIPETIQHDDFHDGQVFVKDGRYLLLDWGDACVSHPFFTLAVTLEGVIAWGVDDMANSRTRRRTGTRTSRPFAAYGELSRLKAAARSRYASAGSAVRSTGTSRGGDTDGSKRAVAHVSRRAAVGRSCVGLEPTRLGNGEVSNPNGAKEEPMKTELNKFYELVDESRSR